MHKNEEQTCKTCRTSIIPPKPNKTHISYSSKHQQNHIQQPYFNISTYTQNPRKLGLETWNTVKIRENSYLFLKIDEENEGFVSENGAFGRGRGEEDKVCLHDARENWKVFENYLRFNPICAKHMIFATQMTHKQVAKTSRQKPIYKILKILSKSFSRIRDPLASELRKLQCSLAIGASTRDIVVKMSR